MSNIMENRVSITLTEDELAKLATQRNASMAILTPKTVALTEDELASLSSMAVDNFVFVQDAVKTTDADGVKLLPPDIAAMVPEMHTDVTFYGQLDVEDALLTDMLNRIRHTKRLVAHESFGVANKVYEMYKALANSGVPGAAARYNILKERYKDSGAGRPSVND